MSRVLAHYPKDRARVGGITVRRTVSRGSFFDTCHDQLSFETRRESRVLVAMFCGGDSEPHERVVLHGSARYPYLWQGFLQFLHAGIGYLGSPKV